MTLLAVDGDSDAAVVEARPGAATARLAGLPPVVRRSAVMVPVTGLDHLIGGWRDRHDPSAAVGVPAHVTLLYPFVPGADIGRAVPVLRTVFADVRAGQFNLGHVGVFPWVTWLAPEPVELFRDLTRRLIDRFPACRPYDGAFGVPTPHATVIDHSTREGDYDGYADAHRRFVAGIETSLPVTVPFTEIRLIVEHDDGMWSTHTTFGLR